MDILICENRLSVDIEIGQLLDVSVIAGQSALHLIFVISRVLGKTVLDAFYSGCWVEYGVIAIACDVVHLSVGQAFHDSVIRDVQDEDSTDGDGQTDR